MAGISSSTRALWKGIIEYTETEKRGEDICAKFEIHGYTLSNAIKRMRDEGIQFISAKRYIHLDMDVKAALKILRTIKTDGRDGCSGNRKDKKLFHSTAPWFVLTPGCQNLY